MVCPGHHATEQVLSRRRVRLAIAIKNLGATLQNLRQALVRRLCNEGKITKWALFLFAQSLHCRAQSLALIVTVDLSGKLPLLEVWKVKGQVRRHCCHD